MSVISYYAPLKGNEVVGNVETRALFLLNMMSFTYVFVKSNNLVFINESDIIYVFVKSMIFVVIVMYEYYVLLKRKENACEETFVSKF